MNHNYLLPEIEDDLIKIPSTPVLKEKWIGAMLDETGRNYSGALRLDFLPHCNKEKVFDAVAGTLAHYPILAAAFNLEDNDIVGYAPKEEVLFKVIRKQLDINYTDLTDEKFIEYSGRKAYETGLRIAESVNDMGIHVWIGFWVFTCDGVSIDILINEIADRYCGKASEDKKSWKEYANDEKNKVLNKYELIEKVYKTPGPYGIDAVSLSEPNVRGKTKSIPFSSDIIHKDLLEASRANHVTLFSVLFGAFQRAISKVSGVDVVVTGVPFINRNNSEDYFVVGPLSNTIPIAIEAKIEKSLKSVIKDIQKQIIRAAERQNIEVSALYPKGFSPRNVNYELPFPQLFNAWNSKSEGRKVALDNANYIYTKLLHNDTCRVGFEITLNENSKYVSGRIDFDINAYEKKEELIIKYMIDDLKSFLNY